jgi:hypothetical protein
MLVILMMLRWQSCFINCSVVFFCSKGNYTWDMLQECNATCQVHKCLLSSTELQPKLAWSELLNPVDACKQPFGVATIGGACWWSNHIKRDAVIKFDVDKG